MNIYSYPTQHNQVFNGKYKRTDKGTPYYHTNSAMKIGGTFAGFSALISILELLTKSSFKKGANKAGNLIPNIPKKINKTNIIARGLISIAIHLGCASIIDYKRNKKSQEIADFTRKVGIKQAFINYEDLDLTKRGRAFYDSNTGAKYGFWLGIGSGAINTLIEILNFPNKKALPKTATAISTIIGLGLSGLGGWLLGKWSDNIANKDTRDHA